jgi:hypothetical protein
MQARKAGKTPKQVKDLHTPLPASLLRDANAVELVIYKIAP